MASHFQSLLLDDQHLDRCARAGLEPDFSPESGREAQVLRLAALALATSFPTQSARLLAASRRYFREHPEQERQAINDLAGQGIINLAQLRFKLEKLFSRELDASQCHEAEHEITAARSR